ncbi:MAG: galactokinase [Bdellovibrionia bacterium]
MKSLKSILGVEPTIRVQSSGRVNLIGEHTDYNGGFVLPTLIPQQTSIEMRPNGTDRVRVSSTSVEDAGQVLEYSLGHEQRSSGWLDYVQGVTHVLKRQGFSISGFDAVIHSEIPMGGGLSSSAALEVALMRALRQGFSLSLGDVEIARLSQKVENDFVGARVGVMDPMACSLAEPGIALFLDTRSMEYQKVALPKNVELMVIHSGVSHRNCGGGYNTRRSECEQACEQLGVSELRDLGVSDLPRLKVISPLLQKRARHVIQENDRVLAAVQAIRSQDLSRLGELFRESHASMRDDYEVSIPEIDLLVELTCQQPSVYGARLTGGGFGGSIVALVHPHQGPATALQIGSEYQKRTGIEPRILVPAQRSTLTRI